MTKKQVETVTEAPVANSDQSRNLYISVRTFDVQGKTIGERIVDMYHYGTRSWLQNHLWWAMHNSATCEVNQADDKEIAEYIASSTLALQAKFSKLESVAD